LSTGNISIIGLLCIYTVQLTCQRLNSEIFAVYIKTHLNINIHFPHFFANGSYTTFDHSALKSLRIAMTKKTFTLIIILSFLANFYCQAQMPKRPTQKVYISTDFDIFLLSTSVLEKTGMDTKLTPVRFTAIPFLGFNVNYDFSNRVGLYTGLNIKNIGFIEKSKDPDSTVKRRVYTIGIPLGLKIGKIKYGNYVILGVGADFPFNYREKGFTDRGNKTKFNEWFSDRTVRIMPYAFLGVHLNPVLTFKLQYYPSNFLNQDYKTSNTSGGEIKPYVAYNVSTILLTAGIDIPYSPRD
jgi:hypothetical protein